MRIKLVGRTEEDDTVEEGTFQLRSVPAGPYQAHLILGTRIFPLGTVVVTKTNAENLSIHPHAGLREEIRKTAEHKQLTVGAYLKSLGVEPTGR